MANITLSQATKQAVAMPYRDSGVNVMVQPITSGIEFYTLRLALLSEHGIKAEEFDAMGEEGQRKYTGLTLHKHVVTGMDDYIVGEGDNAITVRYGDPAPDKQYKTMGEEVLCTDTWLQEDVLSFAQRQRNYQNGVKVSAMGNSEPPTSSGLQ